jgi:LPXTG-site transpeptidase (sortase) family protein
MHHAENWNWLHNWAYQAPEYQFETTFPYDQWGRPTTSNVAARHTQNIRRDRHAAHLPPSHGTTTGFFSGEFATGPVNPFAPRYNNNPNASHAIGIEESPFALRPGEAGVNVRADGSHEGGFLASTSVAQGGGGNAPHGGPVGDSAPPWTNPGTQGGVTVNHRPMEPAPTQTGNQQGRITTVTPFEDGTIGRITIPALNNRTASVRPGVDLATLDNYVGHFSNTSQWDGTIGLASHNRGRGSFFAGVWTLRRGDRIFYETTLGVRAFEVVSIEQISEMDLSNLDHSHDNSLVLITCVYGRPELRWSVRAIEVV